MKTAWHEGKKLELIKQNSCINLPYVIDGDFVITQSNTCALYLGRKTVPSLPTFEMQILLCA